MKILRFLMASPILFLIFTSVAIPQNNQRENFQLEYWDSYVGSYQIKPGRFAVIGLSWSKKLSYLDTKTGVFGSLEASGDDVFTSKDGTTIRINRSETGKVNGLRWRRLAEAEATGTKSSLQIAHIKLANGSVTLAGTFIRPATEKPHPVIIVNGGASWIVREQNLENALIYAAHGIAALFTISGDSAIRLVNKQSHFRNRPMISWRS